MHENLSGKPRRHSPDGGAHTQPPGAGAGGCAGASVALKQTDRKLNWMEQRPRSRVVLIAIQRGNCESGKYTGACTKVARRSPKPLVVGSIPNRPCQAREKKPMIAADLFANRFGVSWSEVSLVLYGPLARRSSGWLITGWPRFDSWMGHQTRHQPGRYRAVVPEARHHLVAAHDA